MGSNGDIKAQMATHSLLMEYGVAEGPQILNLSLVSFDPKGCARCQAIYCPIHGNGRAEPERCHHAPIELVDRVIEDLPKFDRVPVLRLLPHGELSVYRHLPELAERLAPYGERYPIAANTNGINLGALGPLLPHLTALEVSINAVTDESYRRLRPGARPGDLERLVAATQSMAGAVRHGDLRLKLIVSFVSIDGVNSHEWPVFREFWSGEGAEPVRRPLHSFSGFVPAPSLPPAGPLPPCRSLFCRMTVTSRGDFIRCYNTLGEDVVGRFSGDQTLQSLWYSPENLRGMKVMLGEAPGATIFCSSCADRVCADPRTGVGLGIPFEDHIRRRHKLAFAKGDPAPC